MGNYNYILRGGIKVLFTIKMSGVIFLIPVQFIQYIFCYFILIIEAEVTMKYKLKSCGRQVE